jgi:hypothetical protein
MPLYHYATMPQVQQSNSNVIVIHSVYLPISSVQILGWLVQILNLVLDDMARGVSSCCI